MVDTKVRAAWMLGSLLIAGGGGLAQAEEASPDAQASTEPLGLEEVVVTARKREENLQQVPISITAISAEQLRTQTIKEASDLQYHTPGLEMRGGGGQRDSLDYFIRGQGTTFGGGPAVVTYFADAPLPTGLTGNGLGDNSQFYDLASVQILKGPQGTLFGRSTTGGAVLFDPARPTNDFSGSIQVSAGNYAYREYQGFLNVPLIADKLKIRLAADSVRRDGFTRSLTTGQREDDRNRDSVRLGISFTPTGWLDNYTMFQDNRAHEAGGSVVLIAVNNALPLYNPAPGFTPYGPSGGLIASAVCAGINAANPAAIPACIAQRTAILASLINGANAEVARVQAGGDDAIRENQTSVTTRLSGHTQYITNITKLKAGDLPYIGDVAFKNVLSTFKSFGVEDLRELGGFPVTHATVVTSADVINFVPAYTPTSTGENSYFDHFTEEAQILGTIAGKHNWILGYYLEEHKSDLQDPALFTTFGNVFSPVLTAPTIASQMVGDSLNVIKGYFGQFTLDLSEWVLQGLKFTAGYRWSESYARSLNLKGGYDATGTIMPNVTPGGPCGCTATEPQPTLNDQAPSWNFGFDWQATDKLLTYIQSRRGNKPGGVNILPPVVFPGLEATFAPETLTDVEIGVKWDWSLDGLRGRTNADVYRQWYNNIQRTEFVPNPINPTAPVQQTANIAKARIEGLELDSIVELTDRLSASLTYTYINPRYTQWPGFTAPAPGVVGGLSLVDSPFPGTPRHQGTLGVRYRVPLQTMGDVVAGADYYRQSSVELNDQTLADGGIIPPTKGYGNLNLRLDWENVGSQPIDVDVFVRNATNNVHQVSVNSLWSSFGFISAIYNEPRMWGAEIRYRFGGSAR